MGLIIELEVISNFIDLEKVTIKRQNMKKLLFFLLAVLISLASCQIPTDKRGFGNYYKI